MVDAALLASLAARSLLRLAGAFGLSLLFGISVGYAAATDRRAERVLLPVLDVLQSVPILAFFPAAVFFFASNVPGILGPELAAVFLIFTSMAWNLAFGVYESIKTTPVDIVSAADVLGLRGWRRFRRLVLPSMVPKLVYNGIVSWAGGWYFLTASEIISTNAANITLPGLGAFLLQTSAAGQLGDMFAALLLLIAIAVALEVVAWQPLQAWSARFRYESTTSTETPPPTPMQKVMVYVGELRQARKERRLTTAAPASAAPATHRPVPQAPRQRHLLTRAVRAARLVGLIGLAAGGTLLLGVLALGVANALLRPPPPGAALIPLALLASTARLGAAYVLCLLWTIPAAVYIGRHERASRVLMPIAEVAASVPATALFPVIVLLFVGLTGGLDVPSVLLLLTGMQWYLLFNLVAGVRSLPSELLDASKLLGLKGWVRWRRVLLPAMLPSLLTGSITAWGGGWNALIVSEYVNFGGRQFHAFGIGDLLDQATFVNPDPVLLVDSVLAMVVFIYVVNALVWKRLYRVVLARYRLEV